MTQDPDVLHITSALDTDGKTPVVAWHLNGTDGKISLTEARNQAEAIFSACAIAETEARIAIALSGVERQKGFSPKGREKANKEFLLIRTLLKEVRSPLPEGINPIFGQSSRLPLVDVHWYGQKVQWATAAARSHAYGLIACAESAESDRFLYFFLDEKIGVGRDQANAMIQEYRAYRERCQLDELMQS